MILSPEKKACVVNGPGFGSFLRSAAVRASHLQFNDPLLYYADLGPSAQRLRDVGDLQCILLRLSPMAIVAAAVSCFATPSPRWRRPLSSLPRRNKSAPPPSSRQIPAASSGLEIPASISLPNIQRASAAAALLGAGLVIASLASAAIAFPETAASAAELFPSLPLREPDNALSLPTWAVHVSSVVEWITAMGLVWQYGDKSGYESWKGLSWGMVPLLGGAFCACTWHFFYNSESLDILVALQATLTVIGNLTMCIAAFRIYKSSQGGS